MDVFLVSTSTIAKKSWFWCREDDVLRANFADEFDDALIAYRRNAVGNSELADGPVGRGLTVEVWPEAQQFETLDACPSLSAHEGAATSGKGIGVQCC